MVLVSLAWQGEGYITLDYLPLMRFRLCIHSILYTVLIWYSYISMDEMTNRCGLDKHQSQAVTSYNTGDGSRSTLLWAIKWLLHCILSYHSIRVYTWPDSTGLLGPGYVV